MDGITRRTTGAPVPLLPDAARVQDAEPANVALTAPCQHDGSEATLKEVLRFYNLGGRHPRSHGKALDIRPLNLDEAQLEDLEHSIGVGVKRNSLERLASRSLLGSPPRHSGATPDRGYQIV